MFSGFAIVDGQSQEIKFDSPKRKLRRKKSRRKIINAENSAKVDEKLKSQIDALKMTAKKARLQTPHQTRFEVAQDRREARE